MMLTITNNIQVGSFYLGQECNMTCEYCKIREHVWPKMNTQLNLDVFNFLKENNIDTIVFRNAEPMLYKDKVKEIIEASEDKFKIEITTNGSLIDEKDVRFFNEHNVNIFLSWDGHKASTAYRRYDALENNTCLFSLNNITIFPTIRNLTYLKEFINDILILSDKYKKIFPFILHLYDEQPEPFGDEQETRIYMDSLCNRIDNIMKNGERSYADSTLLNFMLLAAFNHIMKIKQHEIIMSPAGELFQVFRDNPETKRFGSSGTISNPNMVTFDHRGAKCFECDLAYICCRTRSGMGNNFEEHCLIRKSIFQPLYNFIEDKFTDYKFIDALIQRRKHE